MARTDFDGNVNVNGQLNVVGAVTVPPGSFRNADISATAGIEATKLEHQFPVNSELFGPAVTVAALTKMLHTVRGVTGTVVGFEGIISVVADDVSRTITLDLKKSSSGGAFASILSATIDFTNASVVRVPVAATFSSTALVDGDILQAVVTVAGSSGNQATGLHCTLMLRETAT